MKVIPEICRAHINIPKRSIRRRNLKETIQWQIKIWSKEHNKKPMVNFTYPLSECMLKQIYSNDKGEGTSINII